MSTVTSEDVAHWVRYTEGIAQHYAHIAEKMAMRSNGLFNSPAGAEFDDLVQVGLEQCWKSLEAGYVPVESVLANAMKDHLRVVFKQRGDNV